MRKTITGTGGMLLIQTHKDAGVEYLSFAKTAPNSVGDVTCSHDSQERQETAASGSTAGRQQLGP
jgi:hypothetical protein